MRIHIVTLLSETANLTILIVGLIMYLDTVL